MQPGAKYSRRVQPQAPGQMGMPQMGANMPGMNGLGQMQPGMPGMMPNMPQPMYGAQGGAGFTPNAAPAMGGVAGAGLGGTMPMQQQMTPGQTAGIPTPSQPTQRTVSSLSGISRPTAPLESKVEAKSIKIPDFLKNNK